MPKGEKQQILVLTATLEPGDKTVFHTRRLTVTLYILEEVFTLELEGRSPVTIRACEAMAEPPNVKMTGLIAAQLNRSGLSPSMSVIQTRLSSIPSTRQCYGRVEICLSASGHSVVLTAPITSDLARQATRHDGAGAQASPRLGALNRVRDRQARRRKSGVQPSCARAFSVATCLLSCAML
jgi:hypothetical protein